MEEVKQPLVDAEIASLDKDITRAYLFQLLESQDRILKQKGNGTLDIYEHVLEDEQVHSCLQQRFSALTSCEWEVDPGSERRDAKKAAEWTKELLNRINFDNLTEKMLYATFYGYSVGELMLTRDDDGMITLDPEQGGVRVRNRRRFKFDKGMNVRLLVPNNMTEGEVFAPSRLWLVSTGGDNDDDPYGRGLAHWLYWTVLFKRGGIKHWLNYLERFAQPTVIVKYPNGAGEQEKSNALKVAEAIKSGRGIAAAESLITELLEATRSGTADYAELHKVCNEAIAKVILSQTMTTEDGSSRAQAEVHQGVAEAVVKRDADLICNSFNQEVLAKRLIKWNFGENVDPPRVWRRVEQEEDINTRADRDVKLYGLGYQIKPDAVQDIYGPDYEPRQPQTPPQLPGQEPPQQPGQGTAEQNGQEPNAQEQQPGGQQTTSLSQPERIRSGLIYELADQLEQKDNPDRIANRTAIEANQYVRGWAVMLAKQLDAADNLEQFESVLLSMFPQMQSSDLAAVVADSLTVAGLTGWLEAKA
jgi:phage gp29-like protein